MNKFLLKKFFCIILVYSGICRLFSFVNRNSVTILLYHGIVNNYLPPTLNREGLHLQLKSFERQIKYLKKYYNVLDINRFVEHIRNNSPIPKYSVILTFDDGFKNNYENLQKIVLKYKIPLSIFVVTDYVGTSELLWVDKLEMAFFNTTKKSLTSLQSMEIGCIEWNSDEDKMGKYDVLKNYLKNISHEKLQYALKNVFYELAAEEKNDLNCDNSNISYTQLMNWSEVKELARYGVRFGSHACCHEILTALPEKEVDEALKRSFLSMKDYYKTEGIPFAYPNGNFNDNIKKKVAKAGYNCALTTVHGFNPPGCDLYALKRNEVGNKGDIHLFIANLSGTLDFIKFLVKILKK